MREESGKTPFQTLRMILLLFTHYENRKSDARNRANLGMLALMALTVMNLSSIAESGVPGAVLVSLQLIDR